MATTSISCPECGNTLWDIWGNTAQCTNCLTERPFTSRQSKTGNPSQLIKIEVIKQYFSEKAEGELVNWQVTFQKDTGFAYISVDTSNSPYLNEGGSFKVGPRGKVTCLSVHNITSNKNLWKESWEGRFAR